MANRREKKDKQYIQVFARIRPFNKKELQQSSRRYMDVIGKDVNLNLPHGSKRYSFDKVFDMHSKQVDVYQEAISPIIDEVLNGYNCTVFAYGQTGSGKTYTMVGPEAAEDGMLHTDDSNMGIIPRVFGHIFDKLNKQVDVNDFTVRVSYLEIYNEVLYDLLNEDDKNLRIYEDPKNKSSVQIHGLEEVTVFSRAEVYDILRRGNEKRRIAATYMNEQSSRSHSVFTITVHTKETTPEGEELVKTGKLNLVDLAGSENIQRSGAMDQRAREAGNINQSLLTLGRVIKALVERAGHVPYRESKLTRILQDSLGGKTKTTIIATASPAACNTEETMSTMEYAHRARNIITKPEVNQRMCKTALIKGYLEEIDKLKKDLIAARKCEGFYLHADNYNEMIQESAKNREAYLRAIAQCAEFQDRASALQQQYVQLEEVHSVTQDQLFGVKESLSKSKGDIKQLMVAKRIRQKLIDYYEDRQTEHFKFTKELSIEFDKHINDHNMVCEKITDIYSAMEKNKNTREFMKTNHEQINFQIVECFENISKQCNNELQKLSVCDEENMQVCLTLIEHANGNVQNVFDIFASALLYCGTNVEKSENRFVNELRDVLQLSENQAKLVRASLQKHNEYNSKKFKKTIEHLSEAIQTNETQFSYMTTQMNNTRNDISQKYGATMGNLDRILSKNKERLQSFAEEFDTLQKMILQSQEMNARLQQMFEEQQKKVEMMKQSALDLDSPLADDLRENKKLMQENLSDLNRKTSTASANFQKASEQSNVAFGKIKKEIEFLYKNDADHCHKLLKKVDESASEIEQKCLNINNTEVECANQAVKEIAIYSDKLSNAKSIFGDIVNNLNSSMQTSIEVVNSSVGVAMNLVTSGATTCRQKCSELQALTQGFLNQFEFVQPSGNTPLRKTKRTYVLPPKASKKVLDNETELDITVDEDMNNSMDCNGFISNDSDCEYEGQYIKTLYPSKLSFHSSIDENGKEDAPSEVSVLDT